MRIVLQIFIATLLFCSACFVKPFERETDLAVAKVVKVSDGDTVTVVFAKDGVRKRIRLATIDAPEFKQRFGIQSRESLRGLVYKKNVRVLPIAKDKYGRSRAKDKYGRVVAEIFVDDVNINVEQLKRGFAWHYKFHSKSQSFAKKLIYSQAEESARKAGLGLWRLENPEPPWEYRRQNRNRKFRKQLKSPQQ